MSLKRTLVWLWMFSLAACSPQKNQELIPMSEVEQSVFWVKERLWAVMTKTEFWFAETDFGKKLKMESMIQQMRTERMYYIEWNQVVYNDKNIWFYHNWIFEMISKKKYIPIKDVSSFRRMYSESDIVEMVNLKTNKPNNLSENLIEEAVVIDWKFYYMWEYFPQVDAKSAFIHDANHIVSTSWVFYITKQYAQTSPNWKDWKFKRDIPVVRKIMGAIPWDFNNCEMDKNFISLIIKDYDRYKDTLMKINQSESYYQTDLKNVYYLWMRIDADPKTFMTIFDWYWYDSNHLYYLWKKVANFDVSKLKIFFPATRSLYLSDWKIVIFEWNVLKDCNADSFHVTTYHTDDYTPIAVDVNNVYVWNKKDIKIKRSNYKNKDLYTNISDLYL